MYGMYSVWCCIDVWPYNAVWRCIALYGCMALSVRRDNASLMYVLSEIQVTQALRFAYAAYCPGAAIESWRCYWCVGSGLSNVSVVSDDSLRTQ